MSDLKRLIRAARNQGWQVERTDGGHLRFRPPDATGPPIITPSTPSDWRGLLNLRARLRRSGLHQ